VSNRLAYAGAYNGKIYKQDAASTYVDNSETVTTIDAYWRTGWNDFGNMIDRKDIPYTVLNFTTQTTGTFDFSYGFDFNQDRHTESINMIAIGDVWDGFNWDEGQWGTQSDMSKLINMMGSGKFIQIRVRNNNASEQFSFNGMEFPINDNGPSA